MVCKGRGEVIVSGLFIRCDMFPKNCGRHVRNYYYIYDYMPLEGVTTVYKLLLHGV